MQFSKRSKVLVGAIALAGAIAVTGTAMTATGLANNAGSTQFVGGSVSQSATGATLSSIVYTFGDEPANTAVRSVLLTFADANADAKVPTISFTGGNAVAFTCTAIEATGHTSTCTTAGADRVGITSVTITII